MTAGTTPYVLLLLVATAPVMPRYYVASPWHCPAPEMIHPCKCMESLAGTRILCSGIPSPEVLRSPFRYLSVYQLSTLTLQNIQFPITVDLFSGLNVVSIKILASVYRVKNGRHETPPTFVNLEEKLRRLYVTETTLDLGNTNLGAMRRLSRVDIQSSTIDVLRKGWFDGLTDLDTFLLSDSTVRVLDDEVLSGLANVNTIVLRSSRLNVVRRNYFPPIAYELKVLDLR